jgi:predicted N-acetyltransferase YhbS
MADPTIETQALRIARHTERLDEVVAFYRDGIGLPEIGGFSEHDGYDGVFLAVPGTRAHLELTAGGEHGAPAPHPESLVVLYLGDDDAVTQLLARSGARPVAPANPYWADHGVTVEDPDGFRVVLVPARWGDGPAGEIRVVEHAGPRSQLRSLFELAEDSARELDAYIEDGRVLVAVDGDEVVGHVQLTPIAEQPTDIEVKNMAVDTAHQRRGIGRALMTAAIALARAEEGSRLVVATAAADVGNLRFYQRLGFRMRAIERDAFTPATGYEPGLLIDGIELRDRVWLDLPLD